MAYGLKNASAARKKLKDQSDDGQYQQDVDEASEGVAANDSDQPQNQKNHK